MASDKDRTAIRRLHVIGYRSLYDVELDELPNLVVLHGENGAGKSNLLRAPTLLLQIVACCNPLPPPTSPAMVSYREAHKRFGLTRDDYSKGLPHRMSIRVRGTLGAHLREHWGVASDDFDIAVIIEDKGDALAIHFTVAEIGGVSLVAGVLGRLDEELATQEASDKHLDAVLASERLLRGFLTTDLIRYVKADRALKTGDLEARLFELYNDEDIDRRRALRRLGERLSETGLLASEGQIELNPYKDSETGEPRVKVSVPGVGDLPLDQLGTGQQQLVQITAAITTETSAIAIVEEPEVHLHREFVIRLGEFLAREVEAPDSRLSQLWLSTHHHAFAIAPTYLDVTYSAENGTKVQWRDRAEAAGHFYEPGPLWEALRSLVHSTDNRDRVVLYDPERGDITAGEILDSLDGDGRLAQEFARAATLSIVASFNKSPAQTVP